MEARLYGHGASPPAGPRRTRKVVRAILIVCLAMLLLIGVIKGIRVYPHVRSLVDQARVLRHWTQDAEANLRSPAARAALRSSLGVVRADLAVVRVEGSVLWLALRHLGWVPVVGGDLEASPVLLDAGIDIIEAGLAGLDGIEPVLALSDPGSNIPSVHAVAETLVRLNGSRSQFAEAEQALTSARAGLDSILVYRLSPRIAGPVAELQQYTLVLQAALGLLQGAPSLLGLERPAIYLILAQNDQELRPTGGFISGVGLMRIEQGKIITATLGDSYAVDGDCGYDLPVPGPLREYMWAPELKLRDANWSPDFPSSATVIRSLYRHCQGVDVDGVIAVDLDAVGELLDVLGPLQPEGYVAPVTRANLQDFLAQYWSNPLRSQALSENSDEWWLHRKDFMTDLLREMVRRIAAPGSMPLKRLAEALLRMLQQRHLQVCVDEPSAQRALASAGWDGAVQNRSGDYLLVVDSNVGYRKVNPYVEQRIEYRVDLAPVETAQATLVIDYGNKSSGSVECIAGARYDATYDQMMQGCYWDYVRVYVPRGSRLLSVEGGDSAASITEEQGKTVFGILVIVPPGRSRQLVFTYETPIYPARTPYYELLVQKQAGTREVPLGISVQRAGRLLRCEGCPATVGTDGAVLALTLATDARFTWKSGVRSWYGEARVYVLLLPGLLLLAVALVLGWAQSRRRSATSVD